MALDKKELRKLSPSDRIKRLKELQDQRKEDAEEAEELIKRTREEIERNEDVPDVEVPEIETVDISSMFAPSEGLENTVERAAPSEEEQNPIRYDGTTGEAGQGYNMPDEHDWVEFDVPRRVEDSVKYRSETQRADDLTASRSAAETIKKYTT